MCKRDYRFFVGSNFSLIFTIFIYINSAISLYPQTWISTLPTHLQNSIIWYADAETGNLDQFTYGNNPSAGGGVFNTPLSNPSQAQVTASTGVAHSGNYAFRTEINGAYHEVTRAVRMMRWTDKPWNMGGQYLPSDAYYSTWMYLPHLYDPRQYAPWDTNGDGGWWNVFQFKSYDVNNISQPTFVLNIGRSGGNMRFYLTRIHPTAQTYYPSFTFNIPVGQWFHVEARYVASENPDGLIQIWLNGQLAFDVQNVVTSLPNNPPGTYEHAWGIGNYTDHVVGHPNSDGTAVVYFDDAIISSQRISQVIPETSPALLQIIMLSLFLVIFSKYSGSRRAKS